MENKKIAIIINSFNRLNILKDALQALHTWLPNSTIKDNYLIVIYDAGSTDGTVEWVSNNKEKLNLKIEIVLPKEGDDTSFSAGLNKGVEYAQENLYELDYLLFYETDNQIQNSQPVIDALSILEQNNTLGACGFTVKYLNGKYAGAGMSFPKLINFMLGQRLVKILNLEQNRYQWKDYNGTFFSFLDVVYTSPLLVKLQAWKDSGGLDAQVFPFSDCDIDWAKRLNQLGWMMGVIKCDGVIHDNGQEISSWSKTRAQHFHRARLAYFYRYNPKSVYLIWPHFLRIRHLCEYITAALFVGDKKRKVHLKTQFLNLFNTVRNKYVEN